MIILFLVFIVFSLILAPYIWAYLYIQPTEMWDWFQLLICGAGTGLLVTFGLGLVSIAMLTLFRFFKINHVNELSSELSAYLYVSWLQLSIFAISAIGMFLEWLPIYLVNRWFQPDEILGYWHVFWVKGIVNLVAVVSVILVLFVVIIALDFIKKIFKQGS